MGMRFSVLMLGRRLLIPALLLCAPGAFAQCTGGSPTWTTTIDQSSVTTCISKAASGDIINVSSGSATWSSVTVPSSKGLSMACPSLSCTVSLPAAGAFVVNTNSSQSSIVTGFTFTGGGTYEGGLQVALASGPPYNAPPRLYNNTFTNTGNNTEITIQGFGPMLIDHNTINAGAQAQETIHIEGAQASCTQCWAVDVVPGSANMVFLENNVWNALDSANFCQSEQAYYGAVYVERYNQLNNCEMDSHANSPASARWWEIYNNMYSNGCCSSGEFADLRGGSGVYWGNTVNGTARGGTTTNLGPISGSSDVLGAYPVQYQFGMGSSAGRNYSPAYIWGSGSPQQSPDLYDQQPSMVQIGTAANDPTHCSGMSGSVCNAIYSSSQPSSLERCESAADINAGCPVSYTYAPYVYPHPLDNCPSSTIGTVAGGCSGVVIVPPTNLRAAVQ